MKSRSEKIQDVKLYLSNIKLDTSVMNTTMHVNASYITPRLLLDASAKLIRVYSGEQPQDDRDNLMFAKFLGVEDYVDEHIMHDAGRVQAKAKMKLRQKRNLSWLHSGFFTSQLKSVFVGNALAQNIEGVNPMEQYMLAHKVTKMGGGGIGCHSADTDVFTKTGWKAWPDVTLDDELAIRVDGALSFACPSKLHSGMYSGELLEFDNAHVNALVTPTHRMFVAHSRYNSHTCVRGFSTYSFCSAEEAYGAQWKHMLAADAYSGGKNVEYVDIPPDPFADSLHRATQLQGATRYAAVPFAALVGYYLADGCTSFDEERQEYCVEIGASVAANPDEVEIIAKTLDRLGIEYRCGQGQGFILDGGHLAYYFRQFGKAEDKFIPDWVMEGSMEIREALFNALTRTGCGYIRACGGCTHACAGSRHESASRQLRDQVGHLAILRGMHVNYTDSACFQAKLNNRKEVILSEPACFRRVEYTGMVYCASVPGALLLTRRNGRCIWSGNSTEAIPDSARAVNESQFGLLDPLATVEATTIGVVNFFTHNARKGADGKLYRMVLDPAGKPVWIDHQTFLSSKIDLPEV